MNEFKWAWDYYEDSSEFMGYLYEIQKNPKRVAKLLRKRAEDIGEPAQQD